MRSCRGTGTLAVGRSATARTVRARASSSRRAGTWCSRSRARTAAAPAASRPRGVRRAADSSVEMRTETLTIQVPPGLADGARVRVPGKGHAGLKRRRRGRPLHQRPGRAASRCSGARATTCTWSCRWRFTKRRSAPDRGPGTRRRRAPARSARHAVGAAVPVARARRAVAATAGAAIWWWKCGWCCRDVLDERSKELLREFGRLNSEDVRKDLTTDPGRPPAALATREP